MTESSDRVFSKTCEECGEEFKTIHAEVCLCVDCYRDHEEAFDEFIDGLRNDFEERDD